MLNSFVRKGAVPQSYAGARLVPVYKKKGSPLRCSSYRPVALLMLEAKLLARLCRRSDRDLSTMPLSLGVDQSAELRIRK
eukprot:3461760-Amphidinium_carterae.1